MTATVTPARTPDTIVREAFGEELDALNWSAPDPATFDDKVFEAADRVRRSLTLEEEESMRSCLRDIKYFFDTLEALRGRPGGRNYLTAWIIVEMYWLTEAHDLED